MDKKGNGVVLAAAVRTPVARRNGGYAGVHPARLLERNGLRIGDIDLSEINEAFASVVLSFTDELAADPALRWRARDGHAAGTAVSRSSALTTRKGQQ
jgi:Thiolase, C-terminal domain